VCQEIGKFVCSCRENNPRNLNRYFYNEKCERPFPVAINKYHFRLIHLSPLIHCEQNAVDGEPLWVIPSRSQVLFTEERLNVWRKPCKSSGILADLCQPSSILRHFSCSMKPKKRSHSLSG